MTIIGVFLLLLPAALCLDNGVGLTPARALSTWNRWFLAINETLVKQLADAMVETGLLAAGYEYLNVDAGAWLHERDSAGNLQLNPALFPSGLSALSNYVHSKGLKLGLYTDLGEGSCGPGPGSGGHYEDDAHYLATVGEIDYLKVDYCGAGVPIGAAELAAWGAFAAALNATGRPIYFSICSKFNLPANTTGVLAPYAGESGLYAPPREWSRDDKRAVANAWLVEVRNNVDGWSPSTSECTDVGAPCGVITNIDSQVVLGRWYETGPGGLVDADMLEVCQFNGSANHPGLTVSEGRLHFFVWVILPSPLILSFDPRTLPSTPGGPECLAMVTNPELLAINQDAGVIGASLLAQNSTNAPWPANSSEQVATQVFGRRLTAPAPAWAALLVNRGAAPATLTVSWAALGLPRPDAAAAVRDVGARKDLGSFSASFSAIVPPHDAVFVRIEQS